MRGKKTLITVITSIILAMMLTGCQLGTGKESGSIEQQEVYTGTKAIEIKLIDETIPNYDVTPPYPFQLSVDVVNYGAHPTSGTIIVEGIDNSGLQIFNLPAGRTQYTEKSQPERITFNSVNIDSNKNLFGVDR